MDAGLDAARAFFLRFWKDAFAELGGVRPKDPKTQLQEWAQGRGLPLPAYEIVEREGPAHAPIFTVRVTLQGYDPEEARGRSRQEAEKAAAQVMLLKREGPL